MYDQISHYAEIIWLNTCMDAECVYVQMPLWINLKMIIKLPSYSVYSTSEAKNFDNALKEYFY
jgi:hypothetical protein